MVDVFIKPAPSERILYEREKDILQRLPVHPGLPKLLGYNDRKRTILLEKIEGLTLYQFREKQRRQFAKCLEISTGIAAVLTIVHRKGIVHNELSYNNVMLKGRSRVPVIIDFQDAFRLKVESSLARSRRGTDFFMAPEKYTGTRQFSCLKSDVYSLGALIYYTITGQHQPEALLTNENYPQKLRSLVAECLAENPKKRPRVSEVFSRLSRIY